MMEVVLRRVPSMSTTDDEPSPSGRPGLPATLHAGDARALQAMLGVGSVPPNVVPLRDGILTAKDGEIAELARELEGLRETLRKAQADLLMARLEIAGHLKVIAAYEAIVSDADNPLSSPTGLVFSDGSVHYGRDAVWEEGFDRAARAAGIEDPTTMRRVAKPRREWCREEIKRLEAIRCSADFQASPEIKRDAAGNIVRVWYGRSFPSMQAAEAERARLHEAVRVKIDELRLEMATIEARDYKGPIWKPRR